MAKVIDQSEIEFQVKAHIERLREKVDCSSDAISMSKGDIDPEYRAEDEVALSQVNEIIKDERFKKKLCAGLNKTSSDLDKLAAPLVKVLLPVSAVKGGSVALLGFNWTFANLPVGIIGASVLAIYLARFGIGFFCGD